ncbi:hypothetical protein [Sunxiuqinia dokdonensis]|uniref:Uncharacterized protein n=1 Tax=Sunxiuqinia dokdonensis TaxID=1409788 RepID=A0A0L8V7E4_9BACT|nr:hypothetical protein [Sunxiuqinia dokdonensis]KOH44364.1 hypothetical protein NC99_28110 [Sunxiuqinia dokdonensis]
MKKLGRFLFPLILILAIVILSNCKKTSSEEPIEAQDIAGVVQKGPFISGSSVTLYDLKSDLTPVGKSYNAQIVDNQGSFQLNGIALSSGYVSVRADGFYFNEVAGSQSAAQLTLYALADVTGSGSINVNLLTHLEKPRVEFLMQQGKSFSEAKIQAQREVLAIFSLDKDGVGASESLNISRGGEDNGILLAISSILQGYRSEGALTELLSNISNDIREDGQLDDENLGAALINHAVSLNATAIQANLAKRYQELGATASVPGFGPFITNFITKTSFEPTGPVITYPASGIYGQNILALSTTDYFSGQGNLFSLAAELPKNSALKVRITALSDSDTITTVSADTTEVSGPVTTKAAWYYQTSTNYNWSISDFDMETFSQTFTAIESDQSCGLALFFDRGSFLVEYFEMNAIEPSKEKTITVE